MKTASFAGLAFCALASLAACGDSTPFYATPFERRPTVEQLTALGRALFHDRSLSASGRISCASCHDPAHAYGPPNGLAVQLAGADGKTPGTRAAPSLRYLQHVPAFTEHFFEADGNDAEDQGPAGGHTWDGRARTLHDQAALPLTSPLEMANRDADEVVARVRASSNARAMRDAFGPSVLDDGPRAFRAMVLALEVFQEDPREFYPYDSKYDAYLRGNAKLTRAELRGLQAFNDPARGNCASCHPSGIKEHALPAFSDWGFIALGVPRNPRIAKDGAYDLGLCGPIRTDLASHREYCGRFRTPTLRNAARRSVFFHNGAVKGLEKAVRFYGERDSKPARWYPARGGQVEKFDDLPPSLRDNVSQEAPFGRTKEPLTDADIHDIVAFLRTLDDGYRRAGR
ncbi:MAG TPA: cytochrome c peroxidase [Usitatibacter sp.]|nr:cytochrome c peroxidase [Usitatibacter sp.]